ncbi:MAG: hypothetical protein KAT85_11240 [candidate division Zixibacteria bacterium]|nr:hypothetical protein [candidate division Zixibacteria bacterium]
MSIVLAFADFTRKFPVNDIESSPFFTERLTSVPLVALFGQADILMDMQGLTALVLAIECRYFGYDW